MTRASFLLLALMCENVNAAPQASETPSAYVSGDAQVQSASRPAVAAPFMLASDMPPFSIGHPLCQTGFWIKQRVDDRDRDGIIVKSRWVFGCAKGRIVYGRKV